MGGHGGDFSLKVKEGPNRAKNGPERDENRLNRAKESVFCLKKTDTAFIAIIKEVEHTPLVEKIPSKML